MVKEQAPQRDLTDEEAQAVTERIKTEKREAILDAQASRAFPIFGAEEGMLIRLGFLARGAISRQRDLAEDMIQLREMRQNLHVMDAVRRRLSRIISDNPQAQPGVPRAKGILPSQTESPSKQPISTEDKGLTTKAICEPQKNPTEGQAFAWLCGLYGYTANNVYEAAQNIDALGRDSYRLCVRFSIPRDGLRALRNAPETLQNSFLDGLESGKIKTRQEVRHAVADLRATIGGYREDLKAAEKTITAMQDETRIANRRMREAEANKRSAEVAKDDEIEARKKAEAQRDAKFQASFDGATYFELARTIERSLLRLSTLSDPQMFDDGSGIPCFGAVRVQEAIGDAYIRFHNVMDMLLELGVQRGHVTEDGLKAFRAQIETRTGTSLQMDLAIPAGEFKHVKKAEGDAKENAKADHHDSGEEAHE